ncbi:MAG: NAD(P)/FAD-dependent oxidoreductase [Actinobacteria bacterium]|nr:NAD(P)/FAD-dependent oxidoreductase [Actinomycetota bacterium]
MIVVVGATLAGLAAAARLARVNHEVVVLDRTPVTEADAASPLSPLDENPNLVVLPAAWRDLFKKSGRPLEGALGLHQLRLVPAPPATYLTPAGELTLPADRAGQWHSLVGAVGEDAATAWRNLLDRLDTAWLALRPLGVEAELTASRLSRASRAALRTNETLADLARQAGPLGTLFTELALRRDSDPHRAPGWLGTRLSIERTFGRWQLIDAADAPQPAARLVDVLHHRLADRGVAMRWATEVHRVAPGRVTTADGVLSCRAVVITTSPWRYAALTGQRPPRRLRAAATVGPRWDSWRTLLDLPRLCTPLPGVYVASEFSPAGPEPWAQLLTGALAAYRVHEDLTGQDMRPTNKAWTPPRFRPIPD